MVNGAGGAGGRKEEDGVVEVGIFFQSGMLSLKKEETKLLDGII